MAKLRINKWYRKFVSRNSFAVRVPHFVFRISHLVEFSPSDPSSSSSHCISHIALRVFLFRFCRLQLPSRLKAHRASGKPHHESPSRKRSRWCSRTSFFDVSSGAIVGSSTPLTVTDSNTCRSDSGGTFRLGGFFCYFFSLQIFLLNFFSLFDGIFLIALLHPPP